MSMIDELKEYNFTEQGDALVYSDVPNAVYHDGPGISSSFVRAFGKSQVHATQQEQKTTPPMNFGTAAHSYVVEGDKAFQNDVAVITGSPYTNANKILKQDYLDRGLTVITEKEYEDLKGMRNNLIEEAWAYIDADSKIVENSFYWYEGDVLCKCRPDVMCAPLEPGSGSKDIVIVDYKTTKSCNPDSFIESVKEYGYDMQASWYRRGIQQAGYKVKYFMFVAQEKVHPYASKIFRMKNEDMDKGWERMAKYLQNYQEYEKNGKPTIYNQPNVVDLSI